MGEWYDTFYFLARTLAFSNSAINPIIYAGFNENFRKGMLCFTGKVQYNTNQCDVLSVFTG